MQLFQLPFVQAQRQEIHAILCIVGEKQQKRDNKRPFSIMLKEQLFCCHFDHIKFLALGIMGQSRE